MRFGIPPVETSAAQGRHCPDQLLIPDVVVMVVHPIPAVHGFDPADLSSIHRGKKTDVIIHTDKERMRIRMFTEKHQLGDCIKGLVLLHALATMVRNVMHPFDPSGQIPNDPYPELLKKVGLKASQGITKLLPPGGIGKIGIIDIDHAAKVGLQLYAAKDRINLEIRKEGLFLSNIIRTRSLFSVIPPTLIRKI